MPARYHKTKTNESIKALDSDIIKLMVMGHSNRDIAEELEKPLSTVQRHTRQLIDSGLIKTKYQLDYHKLGYKKGLLHVYLDGGNAFDIAEKMRLIENVLSVSIHIGNSDVVAEYATKDNYELLNLMASAKKLPGVVRVVWSEEVGMLDAIKPPMPIA